jgi:hypothetical protein
MENHRFDALARTLAVLADRRAVVRGIAGAIAAVGAAGGARVVAARPSRTCRASGASCTRASQCCAGACPSGASTPRRQRNRCGCPVGQALCDGVCQDVYWDAANCGACGNVCPGDEVCVAGACGVSRCAELGLTCYFFPFWPAGGEATCLTEAPLTCSPDTGKGAIGCVVDIEGCMVEFCTLYDIDGTNPGPLHNKPCSSTADCLDLTYPYRCVTGYDYGSGWTQLPEPVCLGISGWFAPDCYT